MVVNGPEGCIFNGGKWTGGSIFNGGKWTGGVYIQWW